MGFCLVYLRFRKINIVVVVGFLVTMMTPPRGSDNVRCIDLQVTPVKFSHSLGQKISLTLTHFSHSAWLSESSMGPYEYHSKRLFSIIS